MTRGTRKGSCDFYSNDESVADLLHKQREERELDAEVRAHELLLADEKIRSGMSVQEAQRQARLELGGVEQVKEQVREIRSGHVLETLFQDVRFGLRMLRKSPGFTAVAVLTFGLGIGANAAIFSFVNAIVLRPLPFSDPSRLVSVLDTKPSNEADWLFVSPNRFEEFVRRSSAFEQIAGAENCYFRLESGGAPVLLQGGCASASFFPMLGVKPFLGHMFTPEQDRPGGSYGCWKQYFGGDPGLLVKPSTVLPTMRNLRLLESCRPISNLRPSNLLFGPPWEHTRTIGPGMTTTFWCLPACRYHS